MKGSLGGSTGEKAAGACYAYPLLGGMDFPGMRIGGPGLGNLLLPWARCQVAAERHGWTRIAPTWPQVKAGPILRGETDWRTYVGLFRTAPGEVAGLRKFLLLRGGRRVAESAAGDGRVPEGGRVVVLEGLEGGLGGGGGGGGPRGGSGGGGGGGSRGGGGGGSAPSSGRKRW